LYSQIEKGNIIISGEGSYIKATTEAGVTSNIYGVEGKHLGLSTSIGYFFTNKWVAGVGFDYYWSKETRLSELYINDFLQVEEMNIKANGFLPNVYVGYYYPVISKLYFTRNFKIGFGKLKTEYSCMIAGIEKVSDQTINLLYGSNSYLNEYNKSDEVDIFSSSFYPELVYFIRPNIGLNIGMGGVEYTMLDWKTDNSNWVINFNPSQWRYGIKVNL